MDRERQASFVADMQTVHNRSSDLLDAYVNLIEHLDENADFARIVTYAQQAGLVKEDFLGAFTCSWSTITRWAAGHVRPARVARPAVKAKLLEMLRQKRSEHLAEAQHILEAA